MGSRASDGFVASEAALHEQAIADAGCDDFGPEAYLDGLRALLRSLDEAQDLSPLGRTILRRQIVTSLTTRLRSERRLREHPEAADVAIPRPIFITGLVRTGSTALHYLMGQDPGIQKLEYWLSAQPQPRPQRDTWDEHPDFRQSVDQLAFLYEHTPDLMAIHEMKADWPEECGHILAQSFTDDRFECSANLPGYGEWYHHTAHPDAYVRHRRLIQLIGSTSPDRRWLLKYPVHLRQLPALFAVYPDACIVQTHRDPCTVLQSYTSFLSKIHRMHRTSVDPEEIARAQLESWAVAAEAGVEYRREHGSEAFFDLHFDDFMADPIGSVKRIYAHFDQTWSPAGEAALERWQQAHPQGKHGEHRYARREFVIPDGEIGERFAGYLDFFGMTPVGSSRNARSIP